MLNTTLGAECHGESPFLNCTATFPAMIIIMTSWDLWSESTTTISHAGTTPMIMMASWLKLKTISQGQPSDTILMEGKNYRVATSWESFGFFLLFLNFVYESWKIFGKFSRDLPGENVIF